MFPSDTILGVFLIFQLCVGILANSFLFVLHVYTYLVQPHFKKFIDFIFIHLMIVNTLTIITILIPDIMSSFGVASFLDDSTCKAVLCIYRVARGLSVCTPSILSTFQAITIAPSNSKWAWLKSKLSSLIFPSFLFSWVINLIIYAHVIETVKAKTNHTHVGHGYSHAYCETTQNWNSNQGIFFSVMLMQDLLVVVLMIGTSLYMMNLLYRHHKRSQYLHSSSGPSPAFPERNATHSILLLVSCFVFFYWVNNFVTLSGFYTPEKIPRLGAINAILASCFPTISPFLLMKNNKILSQCISSQPALRTIRFQTALSD